FSEPVSNLQLQIQTSTTGAGGPWTTVISDMVNLMLDPGATQPLLLEYAVPADPSVYWRLHVPVNDSSEAIQGQLMELGLWTCPWSPTPTFTPTSTPTSTATPPLTLPPTITATATNTPTPTSTVTLTAIPTPLGRNC